MGNPRPSYLEAVTFEWEGAYRAHDPEEKGAYGYNITNFVRDLPATWPSINKQGMHPQALALMEKIAHGGSDARTSAEELFLGVGRRTQSIGEGKTSARPINNNADTLSYLNSVKRVIAPLTEKNYNKDYGLGVVKDEYLRHEMMDMIYIRPHSGVWGLVYAATQAGVLSDKRATELGYLYLTPVDANIPAFISGAKGYPLPEDREDERGKGRMYLPTKPAQREALAKLAELVNNATGEQKLAMRGYMHEAREKYFGATVQAEGIRASWGDREGAGLYKAHSGRGNPTEGWLNRADASYAYYNQEGVAEAMRNIRAQSQARAVVSERGQQGDGPSMWSKAAGYLSSTSCTFTGFFCPETTAKKQR